MRKRGAAAADLIVLVFYVFSLSLLWQHSSIVGVFLVSVRTSFHSSFSLTLSGCFFTSWPKFVLTFSGISTFTVWISFLSHLAHSLDQHFQVVFSSVFSRVWCHIYCSLCVYLDQYLQVPPYCTYRSCRVS